MPLKIRAIMYVTVSGVYVFLLELIPTSTKGVCMEKVYVTNVMHSNCFECSANALQCCKKNYDIENITTILENGIIESDYDLKNINAAKILIKPNWVRHNLNALDELCLTTHPNFIIAILNILVKYKPKEIIIGDAPIQGCNWDKLITESFINTVSNIAKESNVSIRIVDFRRTVFSESSNVVSNNRRDISKYVIFDLSDSSYLEPISTDKPIFRVNNYDPDRLAMSHRKGKHLYCIAKELFEVDYVIALPKAKTHQKTGITNALKLMVGLNGDKDYLPHHRVGGTGFGGDCYPGGNPLRRVSEYILDCANKNMGDAKYKLMKKITAILWKLSFPLKVHSLSAGWFGNDTTWRMVMDINKIIKYGKKDGTLSDKKQRTILYICDGIIAGQGDGPLNPDPLPLGIVMISENAAQMDRALAILMGYDIEQIPLIRQSILLEENDCEYYYNGEVVAISDMAKHAVQVKPPRGWPILIN